ncbi:MAG: DUF58 domain-containing protein [Hyphomicrobium sp.]|uniref:DUF58 domain-containing protein n=1 Tax=Hyphomicrobium sp. TaxID=82 RepID=UPI001328F416|nr:DUF58 domain-containing protein [Hyphomicrobium sp.]KAB2938134.1 MAG: DUF58 domain-containing protein [Hyphomicrobium sp.]MBZ0210487.1 DUF58 domain-containing protein [Hyphomicrobium sp.]
MANAVHSRQDPASGAGVLALEREAHGLADRLPEILIDAQRIAQTVAHGLHGRRRAGPGETFWQFRQFQSSDTLRQIDWRRSASSDHLYVREREWEAAHTVWLWPDLSESMNFRSHLATTTKRDRALLLMLAAAELLVRGGERVALLGLTPPTASRKATTRMAEAILAHEGTPILQSTQPPKLHLARFSGAILISDFLDPIERTRAHVEQLAADGAVGHLIEIVDPAEETLPYEGRTEFLSPDGGQRWVADRVQSLRAQYKERLEAHRAQLMELAGRVGWSFLVHHTDRSPAEPLLSLIMRMQGGAGDHRWQSADSAAMQSEARP